MHALQHHHQYAAAPDGGHHHHRHHHHHHPRTHAAPLSTAVDGSGAIVAHDAAAAGAGGSAADGARAAVSRVTRSGRVVTPVALFAVEQAKLDETKASAGRRSASRGSPPATGVPPSSLRSQQRSAADTVAPIEPPGTPAPPLDVISPVRGAPPALAGTSERATGPTSLPRDSAARRSERIAVAQALKASTAAAAAASASADQPPPTAQIQLPSTLAQGGHQRDSGGGGGAVAAPVAQLWKAPHPALASGDGRAGAPTAAAALVSTQASMGGRSLSSLFESQATDGGGPFRLTTRIAAIAGGSSAAAASAAPGGLLADTVALDAAHVAESSAGAVAPTPHAAIGEGKLHCLAMALKDGTVYCYACDEWVLRCVLAGEGGGGGGGGLDVINRCPCGCACAVTVGW